MEIEDEKIDSDEAALATVQLVGCSAFRTFFQLWVLWSDKDYKAVATAASCKSNDVLSFYTGRNKGKTRLDWTLILLTNEEGWNSKETLGTNPFNRVPDQIFQYERSSNM